MIDLSGVFIPAVTPFLPETGEIDLPSMQENLRRWGDFPIRGIVIAGTTGEAVLVDEEERLELVRGAREALNPNVLLTVGTGMESTRATIRLNRAVA
ncbi:MAG: dihydrodipicolinate synthase family protein, partial [Longimicrobiales bacterium]|nr:dihydrodipicolinate synthase family protein [Longimicrobiales bacterium]